MNQRLEIRTLGCVSIQLDGQVVQGFVSAKAKGLLLYLACNPRLHPRETLAESLWPDRPPGAARRNLSVVLSNLRQLFDSFLIISYETISIDPSSPVWIDATAFENGVARWEHLTIDQLEAALALYQGAFLDGFYFGESIEMDGWVTQTRTYYHDLALRAFDALIDQLSHRHQYDVALSHAYHLLQLEPQRAQTYCHLMRLYTWRGEIDKALELFESYASIEMLPSNMVSLYNQIATGSLAEPPLTPIVVLPAAPAAEAASEAFYPPCDAVVIQTVHDVLYRAPHLFGRAKLLAEIQAWLDRGTRVDLYGFGGVGKTVLAGEVVIQRLEQSGGPIVWLEAGMEDADALLIALGLAFQEQQAIVSARGEMRLQRVRNLLVEYQVRLLVIDNAWNAHALEHVLRACPVDLPALVTSRGPFAVGKTIHVPDLAAQDALELLSHHACRVFDADEPNAAELCEWLGYHPFALEIAGKVLDTDELTPNELICRMESAPHRLLMPGFPHLNVQSLIETSVTVLDEPARDTFLAFGALYTPAATAELLALCLNRALADTENALSALRRRGLVERLRLPCDQIVHRVHDLSFSYAREQAVLPPPVVIKACRQYTRAHLDDLRALDAERMNILNAARIAHQTGDTYGLIEIMQVLAVDGPYVKSRGYDRLLLEQMDHAIEAARVQGSAGQFILHYLLGKRGDAFRYQNQVDEALDHYMESLQLARRLNLPERQVILLVVISALYADQRQHAEAAALAEEAHDLALRLGQDEILARVLQLRGYCAQAQQDIEAARTWFSQNVALARRINNTYELFFALHNLGAAEHDLGHYDAALTAFNENLCMAEAKDNLFWRALALFSLGMSHFERGDDICLVRQLLNEAHMLFRDQGITLKAARVETYCQKHQIDLEPGVGQEGAGTND